MTPREQKRSNLRTIVRGSYDVQQLRIQMGNRIVANFKAKLGMEPGKKEEDTIDSEGKKLLKNLRASYAKLTDGVAKFPSQKSFKGDELISSYTELCLISQYLELESNEKDHFNRLGYILREYPIYTEFLQGVKGVGPAMAGVVLSEFDIYKARYPSSMWKYSGLDVASDGKGRSRRKEHLREYEYVDSKGKTQLKKGITYNPFLRTKLLGVLASSFLRAGEHKYSDEYKNYKHRLENHEKYGVRNEVSKAEATKMRKEGKYVPTKNHRHMMSMRYMVKRFIVDLYKKWRALEGLEVAPEYSEGKLGMKHGDAA